MSEDLEFLKVKKWLSKPSRLIDAGLGIRLAIDWVIDGPRTQRYSVDQLKTGERQYIGNRIEHELLHQWGLLKEKPLDCLIEGVPVDVKFSLKNDWMIPREAVDQLCIIVTAQDAKACFSVGLLRARMEHLGSPNQDKKRGITAAGRRSIDWLVKDGPLPKNFLLHLDPKKREKIFSHTSGQQRVNDLFRLVRDKPIPINAVDTVAVQRDPSKRIRHNGGARDFLRLEGIVIYGWHRDNDKLRRLGRPPLPRDYWMSIKVGDNEDDIRRLGAEPAGKTSMMR